MTPIILINGQMPDDLSRALCAHDRGFHYGDGLFETALLRAGRVRFLEDHLDRLRRGCEQLGIDTPPHSGVLADIERVTHAARDGVLKIILSRGSGRRGYRPDGPQSATEQRTTRFVALYAAPAQPDRREITLRWCDTRLGRNARLAGIKHLNRLEQVLAQAEWRDERIEEGLMLDTEGELVCGTASNVFIVRDGVLATPDLRFCGVRGIMRAQVIKAAAQLGLTLAEEPLWPHDLERASEVFVTNAVRGIRYARALGPLRFADAPVARRISALLEP